MSLIPQVLCFYRGESAKAYIWMEMVRNWEIVCGKEPKEPLESTEEMRQRERKAQAKSKGGTSKRK